MTTRPIDLLITIDPVGHSKSGGPGGNVTTWINVVAKPTTRDRSDVIASLGGKPPPIEFSASTEQYTTVTSHGDFSGMMNQETDAGTSVRQRLEESNEDTTDERSVGWGFEGEWVIGRRCSGRISCEL